MTEKDINQDETTKYGVLFHVPDYWIDFTQRGLMKLLAKDFPGGKRISLQSGDLDDIAFQIGYQPLERCSYQSGYILPMRNSKPLQDCDWFEKIRFKQTVELSTWVFNLMDGGRKVFPNEGAQELRPYLEEIKTSKVFSIDDLENVYQSDDIDKRIFPTKESLKESLSEQGITFSEHVVGSVIPKGTLDKINKKYEKKNSISDFDGPIYRFITFAR